MLGSLTFGGIDTSRRIYNNVNFTLAHDENRDVLACLQSVTSSYANGTAVTLLSNSIWTFIDSTLPFIYLPLDSCRLFETNFGLSWDSTRQLYTLSSEHHQALLQSNPSFTFRIGNTLSGGEAVSLVLPYTSFDLTAKAPRMPQDTFYFPIRRATNATQYTIGRAFLQEA